MNLLDALPASSTQINALALLNFIMQTPQPHPPAGEFIPPPLGGDA
jgi:hypothetical protein